MKSFINAPHILLSALLVGTTALSTTAYADCVNCGQTDSTIASSKTNIFKGVQPRITTKREIFGNHTKRSNDSKNWKISHKGPIFGEDDCSRNYGPLFGDNTCVTRKCGGAMFGSQSCARPEIPCENCATKPTQPKRAFIQTYKTTPADIFHRAHKCSDLASFQLEWVDFRINDSYSESYSRKLGNYRFRLFGCRRFSKEAMLNEGRIIQKDMQFIDIFEDVVKDCYNIVKVPNDLCLRDQDYEAPEYILTAEITDYFMNVCDGYNWDEAQATDKRTGSAEMTVTWRLLDLTKTKVIWKGETTGYSDLNDGSYNGEIDLIERAFADATLNLKGMPEFEEHLAQRVPADIIEQQKTTLLAIEQATDPVKCKVEIPQASTCPVIEDNLVEQCTMPAEVIEYEPQMTELVYTTPENDTIPLEIGEIPYAENSGSVCYGYNNNDLYLEYDNEAEAKTSYPLPQNGVCKATISDFIEPTTNACENPLFGQNEEDCDPSLISFIKADRECSGRDFEQIIEDTNPHICLFANEVESAGGISIDSGYTNPEIETSTIVQNIKPAPDWMPYTQETISRQPDIIPATVETLTDTADIIQTSEIANIEQPVEVAENANVVDEAGGINISKGSEEQSTLGIIEKGDYKEKDHFCIENIAPFPDMRPENLYRVRASMMSVRNGKNVQSAGLLIADDLILTSADTIDEDTQYYDIETINGVKEKAKVIRINVKKNIALLQTNQKMYFRPLSLNMDLPKVGQKGYMSLGLLNNAEGENYLDDKGEIKGYRFSETMGTEIITDTFVQTVSSGGALIDAKGVVTGLASRNQRFNDKGDLFLPIQDAINSVGLEVCGQAEPFKQPPMAIVKPISTAIDTYKGSKEPAVMSKGKRK